jgi:hypothetical protein
MDPLRRASRHTAALVALVVASIVVAACGTSSATATPSPTTPPASPSPTSTAQPTPSPDPATVYAAIERQVEQIRQLDAKKPVTPALLDEAQLKKNMTAQFDKDTPPAVVAATEKLYQLLGLIPAGSSLRDLYVQLLGSQVAGYYDPDTKELYVVSSTGGLGPTERFVFSHEFDHALQDQNFDLKNLGLDSIGQGDAALAHLSVAEGDATLLMTLWAQSNMTPAEMLAMATDPVAAEQMQVFNKMPLILRQTLMFPYTSGLQMVTDAYATGGWKSVDALYAKPPASTEQVLHADKYAAGEAPVEVAFPKDLAKRLGSGWSVDLQDTLGEFQLATWLENAGVPKAMATTAAAGWGGDRVALVTNGDRTGAVIDTRWDSPAEATEFATAAQQALDEIGGHHAMIAIDGTDRVTLFVATDDPTITALGSALGLAG